jgi:hypothetical protein
MALHPRKEVHHDRLPSGIESFSSKSIFNVKQHTTKAETIYHCGVEEPKRIKRLYETDCGVD